MLSQGPTASVTICALDFGDFLDLACAQIRRYGSSEPIIPRAQIALLGSVSTAATVDVSTRRADAARQLDLILCDAERCIQQPADFEPVRSDGAALTQELARPADGR
ncbi:MAG: hypothetical protein EOP32_02795 [Rhodococcus sp. (in: high G+C Gram-positive bacteria)]|nr:MAG: hypothetical protein EOP32_02795 [Rhodococcus sp. (in: high G+C Gram-positive bacteria)]